MTKIILILLLLLLIVFVSLKVFEFIEKIEEAEKEIDKSIKNRESGEFVYDRRKVFEEMSKDV